MHYRSLLLHPDYQTRLKRFSQVSLLKKAAAILTLGGSLSAAMHCDLARWCKSSRHRAIALLEFCPLFGGLVAQIEKLVLRAQKLTPEDKRIRNCLQYMQESPKSVLVRANEHKPLTIKCSLIDHFASHMAVSVVFFYKKHIDENAFADAIRHVLKDFSLFGGVLKKVEGALYIDCSNQGVSLSVVRSRLNLSALGADFSSFRSTIFVDEIRPSLALKPKRPLLNLRLSYFADGGCSLGCSWHHAVGDMATFMEFMKAVSARVRGEPYSIPILPEDREEYFRSPVPREPQPHGLRYLTAIDIFRFLKQRLSSMRTVHFHFTEKEIRSMREALSRQTGKALSRNDALSAHIVEMAGRCRVDRAKMRYAYIAVNCRQRFNIPPNAMGNSLGAVSFEFPGSWTSAQLADRICEGRTNFLYDPSAIQKFVDQKGGIKKVRRIVPKEFLPQYQNFMLSSWVNFGAYSIDLGGGQPNLFMPIGRDPLPWSARIVEGFNNQGRLAVLHLPSRVAKRLVHPEMVRQVHRYRPHD